MVLRKKVTAAVLAGVLATAAIAPMGLTASAASNGDVEVQYIAGALVPDDGDGTYYVTIPSNVLFSGENDTRDMSVNLMNVDASKDLDPNLSVQVDVYSKNDYKLKNDQYTTTEGAYTLTYTGEGASSTALKNATTGTPSATNGAKAGDLTPDAATLSGTAEMTAEPSVDTQGVSFTDTLTYYVTQTASSKG